MSGAILTLPQYAFMEWCSVKHRDNFTFTFIFDNLSYCQLQKRAVLLGVVSLLASVCNTEFYDLMREVKNAWSYTSILPYVFIGWRLVTYRIRLHGMVLS